VTIIPQDPTLFTGSLRFNIDPEKKATDSEILNLLEKAGLNHLTTRESSSSAQDKNEEISGMVAARKNSELKALRGDNPETGGLLSLQI
jgi:ABC-type transport system involved in cytochrome bd biosynthesis fused ATPase/permease subunit